MSENQSVKNSQEYASNMGHETVNEAAAPEPDSGLWSILVMSTMHGIPADNSLDKLFLSFPLLRSTT